MAPIPTRDIHIKPATVAPGVPIARPLSNPPTITDPNPVSNANTLSNPAAIVEALLEFGFELKSGEDSWPVDEQISCLLIDPLRQYRWPQS